MCPHYEPEIEDIEKEIECIGGILEGVRYFHRLDIIRFNQSSPVDTEPKEPVA